MADKRLMYWRTPSPPLIAKVMIYFHFFGSPSLKLFAFWADPVGWLLTLAVKVHKGLLLVDKLQLTWSLVMYNAHCMYIVCTLYIDDAAEVVENIVDNFLVLIEKYVLFFLRFVLLNNL